MKEYLGFLHNYMLGMWVCRSRNLRYLKFQMMMRLAMIGGDNDF